MSDPISFKLEDELEKAFQLLESGNKSEGDELIQQIANEHPEHYLSLYGLGLIAAFMGDHAQAEQHFEQSIAIEPEYALAHYNLGFCYQKLNKIDLMIKHFYIATQVATDEEMELLSHVEAALTEFKDSLPDNMTIEDFINNIEE